MPTSAKGRVTDTATPGKGLDALTVLLEDLSQIHDRHFLGKPASTQVDGSFSIGDLGLPPNPNAPVQQGQRKKLQLSIRLGQLVLKQVQQLDDGTQDIMDFGTIVIPRTEAESWRATLGSGTETRVSKGNAIRWLVDNVDGWREAARVIEGASTLDVMQLTIDVGDVHKDNPVVILKFAPADKISFDPVDTISNGKFVIQAHKSDFSNAKEFADHRVEEALLAVTNPPPSPKEVRIQIPRMSLDQNIYRDAAAALTGGTVLFALGIGAIFLIGGIVFIIIGVLLAVIGGISFIAANILPFMPRVFADHYDDKVSHTVILQKWFDDAAASRHIDTSHLKVRQMIDRSFNITHAKVVMDRGKEVILLGSPFEQSYFDSAAHTIDSGTRGAKASKGPIHDVSVGVRGPALKDFHDLFKSHWKIAEPTETLVDPVVSTDPVPAQPDEFNSTVQLVLTLDKMFSGPGETDGEKGILEAYLRAIHFAKRFIYIENQYFYTPQVIDALIDELSAKPTLQAILLLNISPDMPYYLRWQRRAIKRMVDAMTKQYKTDPVNKHFRVFSSFSHAAKDTFHPKPRLLDNYFHTKSAIIDNVWATVGSANLDGASMYAEDYFKSVVDGEVRHTEANVLVYEDTPVTQSAVDALRRRLWAEHLGIVVDSQPDVLNLESPDLNDNPDKIDWLDFWSQKADAKLNGLKNDPNAVSPTHILPVDVDYGPDTEAGSRVSRFLANSFLNNRGEVADHYALGSYLDHTFRQDKPPKRTVGEFDLDAPPNFPFTYP